jgi:hypothetical protein
MSPMRATGPRKVPPKWPNGELWGVVGHDGRGPFFTGVIVSDGVVRSVPPLMAWMQGRLWLECAQLCVDRGWRVWCSEEEQKRLRQEEARNARGSVQLGMDLP